MSDERMIVGDVIDCPLCGGSGQMVYAVGPADDETDGPVEIHEMECPECFGSGQVRECRCAACGSPITAIHLAAWDLERGG